MTFKDAKILRDEIKDTGTHCTVPIGYGPDKYFCRIWLCDHDKGGLIPVDFRDWHSWAKYRDAREQKRITRDREISHIERRSPIDIMIDRACGVKS